LESGVIGNRTNRTNAILSLRGEQEQYEMDCAMWYGALTDPVGDANKRLMLKRIFSVLYYGGLMVRTRDGWSFWNGSGVPVAAALSHGGRVLIQLPRNKAEQFWSWLWGGLDPARNHRMAATHGVMFDPQPQKMPSGADKWITETKSGQSNCHYGVNIAMGGTSYRNPYSGNVISDDGTHGHLYIYYENKPRFPYSALMVAVEDSAPVDRYHGNGKGRVAVNNLKVVVPGAHGYAQGQSGKYHTFGSSGKYSATGGKKWEDTRWHLTGGPGFKLDSMFIDLTVADVDAFGTWNSEAYLIDPILIGYDAAKANDTLVVANIPSNEQWKALSKDLGKMTAKIGRSDRQKDGLLSAIDQGVAAYNAAPTQAKAGALRDACMAWLANHATEHTANLVFDLCTRAAVRA
jgi:hypothetical protein